MYTSQTEQVNFRLMFNSEIFALHIVKKLNNGEHNDGDSKPYRGLFMNRTQHL